ncbi:MAG: DoxX family protein [Bdellovibrionaceae bacterium]|nr:DoxX family protein [Bdellovibrio sp.]
MNLKLQHILRAPIQPKCASMALLFLRLVVGIAFIYHGWGKIQNPFGWMPAGAPVPGFFQGLAAFAEFGGGIALVLGLLTHIASIGLAITMLVATYMHAFVLHDPFVNMTGGSSFEPALGYFAIACLFFVVGPGGYSLDHKIFGDRPAK